MRLPRNVMGGTGRYAEWRAVPRAVILPQAERLASAASGRERPTGQTAKPMGWRGTRKR